MRSSGIGKERGREGERGRYIDCERLFPPFYPSGGGLTRPRWGREEEEEGRLKFLRLRRITNGGGKGGEETDDNR